MARQARLVVPGRPHPITHRGRGNLRASVFLADADRTFYQAMLAQCCRKSGVEVWAYCLMTNHIHLIAVPATEESLAGLWGRLTNDIRLWSTLSTGGRETSGRTVSIPR